MIRDPFYRDILDRLKGPLDWEAFERCAQDLLRTVYPGLVPIRGGSDAGMDGAIADGLGRAFPLACTIGTDVRGNLRGSLQQYVRKGGPRRKVVCATSQGLTQDRRQGLEVEAEKQGFQLIQVYDQAAMADLLYGSPKWCQELLNLTGDPLPLSINPVSSRPSIGNCLIGRDEEMQWLGRTEGHRLLVGQPGSGKTFLLREVAKEKDWLFVTCSDMGRIAQGIRSQDPQGLILDDAHASPPLLTQLLHLLAEIDAEIPIIASCWPGEKDEITEALRLSSGRVHELLLLTRPQMEQVLKTFGITDPDRLVYELLNQAEGRPGLAATLTYLCLAGDVDDVVFGDALLRSVRNTFKKLVGARAVNMLAAFAVGGRTGSTVQTVAAGLGTGQGDVRDDAVALAAGGVLYEVNRDRLSVQPEKLRHVLVRDVFFGGATSLDWKPFSTTVHSSDELAQTLIGASGLGAIVPRDLLIPLVEHSRSQDVWEAYAWLGPAESRFVLEREPEMIDALADPTLHHIPQIAIPLLLSKAIDDSRPLHSVPEAPLRLIKDWIKRALPGTREPLRRRKALLEVASDWLLADRDQSIGWRALTIAFYPEFDHGRTDPVLGNTFKFISGMLRVEELAILADQWTQAKKALVATPPKNWEPLLELIRSWVCPPGRLLDDIPKDSRCIMRRHAETMLRDVVDIANDRPGVLHKAKECVDHLGSSIEINLDATFQALFASLDTDEDAAKREEEIRTIAEHWSQEDPRDVVGRVARYECEAASAGIKRRHTPWLCEHLAELAKRPVDWVSALLEIDASADLVGPFLRRSVAIGQDGWKNAVNECLSQGNTKIAAVSVVLTLEEPEPEILNATLRSLDGAVGEIGLLAARNQIPVSTLLLLLQHNDDSVATQAAIGTWNANPKGEIPECLRDDWRKAVLRCKADEYWLVEIFAKDASLAFEWLKRKFGQNEDSLSRNQHATKTAFELISSEHRLQLIRVITDDFRHEDILTELIGQDVGFYSEFLANDQACLQHLAPLAGHPNKGNWVEMAKCALSHGHSITDVAEATFHGGGLVWCGNESDMWKEWIEAFESIRDDLDERIQQVAESGLSCARRSYKFALKQERTEETYGRP